MTDHTPVTAENFFDIPLFEELPDYWGTGRINAFKEDCKTVLGYTKEQALARITEIAENLGLEAQDILEASQKSFEMAKGKLHYPAQPDDDKGFLYNNRDDLVSVDEFSFPNSAVPACYWLLWGVYEGIEDLSEILPLLNATCWDDCDRDIGICVFTCCDY